MHTLLHTAIHWRMVEDLQAQDLSDQSTSVTELCQFISRMSSLEIETWAVTSAAKVWGRERLYTSRVTKQVTPHEKKKIKNLNINNPWEEVVSDLGLLKCSIQECSKRKLQDIQRNRKVWYMLGKKNKSKETVSEWAWMLHLEDFRAAIINMLKEIKP